MREDDSRSTLKWLTESIDRLLARDRMEWARKLQRKSLTSGAIDSDAAPGAPGEGKGGKGKKGKGKGKGKGKRDSSRVSPDASEVKGICHMYVRNGKCCSDSCPYSHLSQDQVRRALGQGSYEKREQSRGSDENDKGSHGRGQGRGKGKGKGKKGSRSKSAGAKGGDVAATETIIHQLKCKQGWCPQHLKGGCPKGDSCPLPHLDEESVNRIKAAERRQKEALLESLRMPLNEVDLHRATKEKANGVKAVVVHNESLPWCDGEEESP